MKLEDLIGRGYLPRELPPPFTARSLARIVRNPRLTTYRGLVTNYSKSIISRPATYNLARAGSLRRKLTIPNPLNMLQVAQLHVDNWPQMIRHCRKSPLSLSTPTVQTTGRAVVARSSPDERPEQRADVRAVSRYILKTDVTEFYPSIYTHSIPWALHGKAKAKSNRNMTLLGNRLDAVTRNAQDGQTISIPIGPDTSLTLSEIILARADQDLLQNQDLRGFRYVDDYEFGVSTFSEAEQLLSELAAVLGKYELQLNPRKTRILELPEPIDNLWVSELRSFRFHSSNRSQGYDIVHYFNRAFELAKAHSDEPVLKYAMSRMRSVVIEEKHWPLFQHLLFQSVMSEPGTLPDVIDYLKLYQEQSYSVETGLLQQVLYSLITRHAPLGHSSEVAWSIWGCLLFSIPIDDGCAEVLGQMDDPIVAVLTLDARSKGLIHQSLDVTEWASSMTGQDLWEPHWLLSYEANVKNWLPTRDSIDHVTTDQYFGLMKAKRVTFYSSSLSRTYSPTRAENYNARFAAAMGYR